MIDKKYIREAWESFVVSGKGEFEYRLLSKESIPSLNIGYNIQKKRCLILELPINFSLKSQEIEKENISLRFFPKQKIACIILNDNNYEDLFNDLILSIYNKISDIASIEEYTSHFIKHINLWSSFFENKNNTLSYEKIKGLFGELFYLQYTLENKSRNGLINTLLKSWRGPYREVHDFVFQDKDVEIKTITNGDAIINISSEFQLEFKEDKKLLLTVVAVDSDDKLGKNLNEMIYNINSIIKKQSGDISIFHSALMQLGIYDLNMSDYNGIRYNVMSLINYNCNHEKFPRIIKSLISKEICNVKYSLQIDMMNEFIIEQTKF